MFESFTEEARDAVVAAQDAARELGHDWIGCEHLLLGLADRGGTASEVLASLGAGEAELRAAVTEVVGPCVDRPDAGALEVIGIDLDEVRRRAEEAFGSGALERTRAGGRLPRRRGATPLTPRSKEALQLALEAAVARHHRGIRAEHVLLGILAQKANVGLSVLAHLGLSPTDVRRALEERLERDAA